MAFVGLGERSGACVPWRTDRSHPDSGAVAVGPPSRSAQCRRVWSGIDDSSDAVRQVRRAETGRKIDENLVLPAEFISTEAPNQYVTIRIKVPESGLAAIQTVKPGEWVTITSRQQPSSDDDAVVSVKPYGASTTEE